MEPAERNQSKELTFEDFKKLANDGKLSAHEKVGFPVSYREGKEDAIFEDITRKLPNLGREGQIVLDIGPGCSGPAVMLIDWCRRHKHHLVLVDSEEMLRQLPSEPFLEKFAGRYPDGCAELVDKYRGKFNAIICYSVLHYIFGETNLFDFLDQSLTLLADGGEMLVGDIPNVSKRKRFFSSPSGIQFHQNFTGKNDIPDVRFNSVEAGKIDDSILLALVLRARNAGCDAYLLPQPDTLPMANRREDLLLRKP
jgi:hypothetical protein